MKHLRFRLFFAWYDFWIGFYYDRKNEHLYFCPLPMTVLEFWIDDGKWH